MDRHNFTATDTVAYIWNELSLPPHALDSLRLPLTTDTNHVPSSFKITHLAQSSVALTALSAALLRSLRDSVPVPTTTVESEHATVEFLSERLYSLGNKLTTGNYNPIGGLYPTSDGYIRVHDSFPHHRAGAKKLLGCPENEEDRSKIAAGAKKWAAIDLETVAIDAGLAMAALRTYEQWDVLPQAQAVADFPILIRKIPDSKRESGLFQPSLAAIDAAAGGVQKCLQGLRVVEMSRVIATPVAGKTLAVHGADVLWVTSPKLPDLPARDRDLSRGKRTIQLDINDSDDRKTLDGLLETAHVFLQGFRPGALASRGLTADQLAQRSQQGIVCANLSAYGPSGPWHERRGFDSLVQTCSGIDVSEAEHYGDCQASKELPCQALDHASGYFLAAGINIALYKQATEGGSYEVNVSLAATAKYLRSLGQFEGKSGFASKGYTKGYEPICAIPDKFFEKRDTEFGLLKAVKHSAQVEGVEVGWDLMPKALGSDEPKWV
ncbi:hypothetical protein B7463_g560, partial [Scytalidium lignicola]